MTSSEVLPKNEDVRLACAFIPETEKRTEVLALYAFLETLRDIPDRVSDPLMGEIRLRWWYEAIEEIAAGRVPRYHPLTEVLKALIDRYNLAPQDFYELIEAQMPLLDKGPVTIEVALGVVDKGEGIVARLAAVVLDPKASPDATRETARFYGMAQLKAQRGQSDGGDAELAHLKREAAQSAMALPVALMPLALPAVLAEGLWSGRPYGPLMKRWRLFLAFVTGGI